jgi:hypothetical protein
MTTYPDKIDETRLREIWSVHEFARQSRLSKMEESRLKMLHGPLARGANA